MKMDPHRADFHNSETGDIYDLYNACNGVLRDDGLLDVTKLEEYGPDDYDALNVPRLREVWDHTTLGCSTCEDIITGLNRLRGTIKEEVNTI